MTTMQRFAEVNKGKPKAEWIEAYKLEFGETDNQWIEFQFKKWSK